MDRRRKLLVAFLLLALGAGAGLAFRPWIVWRLRSLRPVDAEQVRTDAVDLLQVLRPDGRLPETLPPEFWRVWDAQRKRYPPERLEDLRGRLHDYLDFLWAEYSECADIYVSGRRPDEPSDAAREARRRIRAGFGDFADRLEKDADDLREEAYRASPVVGGGVDPDLPNFQEVKEDLRLWLPGAQRRADELTAPLR